jgi:glycosyltransferase involved in cell wall biosynthesis
MNILFAGRLEAVKDPVTFVQVGLLLRLHHFVVAGDGKLMKKCLDLVETECARNIEMLGWVSPSKVSELMEKADIFCQLDRVENIWSTSLVEAMKKKKAIICTDVGYTSRYLKHKEHVYLVRPHVVGDIVSAIDELSSNPKLRAKMGNNAYDFIKQNMTVEKITREILQYVSEFVLDQAH